MEAICKMPQSTTLKGLQCFLPMVSYLNKYPQRLADMGDSLRELIKKNVKFIWGSEHTETFDAIKKETTRVLILRYYDPSKPLTLQTDASLRGLGAVLLQRGHPVYFSSKSLQPHQKAYVAIEHDSLTVASVMGKFHHFVIWQKAQA